MTRKRIDAATLARKYMDDVVSVQKRFGLEVDVSSEAYRQAVQQATNVFEKLESISDPIENASQPIPSS